MVFLIQISTNYVALWLMVVSVIAGLGLRCLYKGLTGDTRVAAITVPRWLLISIGVVFQIPLVYLFVEITTGLFEELHQYL